MAEKEVNKIISWLEKAEWFALGFIVGFVSALLLALYMLLPLLQMVFGR